MSGKLAPKGSIVKHKDGTIGYADPKQPIEPKEIEIRGIIKLTDLLKDIALIKRYSLELNDEKIYLCADSIEQQLHRIVYGNFELEKWEA